MNSGFLDVLSVAHGHLKFQFSKEDADEVVKAKKVISDMLRRGYMIFVKVGGDQKRVRAFDPEHEEYILEEPEELVEEIAPATPKLKSTESVEPKRRGRAARTSRAQRIALRQGQATAIGPTAGG